MLPIRWRAKAQADLAAILEHIAAHNRQAALDLYDDIERIVFSLPTHPYLYRPGRIPGTREIVVHPNYVVVYIVDATAIEIISVMHSRQQYPCP